MYSWYASMSIPYTHVLLKPEYFSEILFCTAVSLIAIVNSTQSTFVWRSQIHKFQESFEN